MDVAIALIPSVLFGFTGLLVMMLGGHPRQQSMGQLLGGFLVAVALVPWFGVLPTWRENLIAFVAGVLLGVGMNLQVRTFHTIGVGRTMPIVTGGQIFGVSALGILLLGEWRIPQALLVGVLGLVLIVGGVAATSWTEKTSEEKVAWAYSLILLLIAVTGLTLYVVSLRYYDLDPIQAMFPVAAGFLTCGFVLTSRRSTPQFGTSDSRWSKYTARNILSGVVWGLGTVFMQYSAANVGVATGFTLSQLGVAISAFGAVFLLGESRTRKEWWVMTAGVVFLLGGTVLVGLAKSLDV